MRSGKILGRLFKGVGDGDELRLWVRRHRFRVNLADTACTEQAKTYSHFLPH